MTKESVKKLLMLLLIIIAVCCPVQIWAAEDVVDKVITGDNINYTGDDNDRFGLTLNTGNNNLVFSADYYANMTTLNGYHTSAWYATKETTSDPTYGYKIDVREGADSVHSYYEEGGASYDTHNFCYADIRGLLEELFPGEDYTENHVFYLHDVFIKKTRTSVSSGWTYHWGKEYPTLDAFMTMYPYDSWNTAARRAEMSHYYNIPFTIRLSAAEITINFLDEAGEKIQESLTTADFERVYYSDEFVYAIPETITADGGEYVFVKGESAAKNFSMDGLTAKVSPVNGDIVIDLTYKRAKEIRKVTVHYKSTDGKVLQEPSVYYAEAGKEKVIPVTPQIVYNRKVYTYDHYASPIKMSKTGDTFVIPKVPEKDVVITAYYKLGGADDGENEETLEEWESDRITGTAAGPIASMLIKSDARGNETYDVSQGIPTDMSLYANGFTSQYMLDYTFVRYTGRYTVRVAVTRPYKFVNYETQMDEEGNEKKVQVVTYNSSTQWYNVVRPYSYWKVEGFHVYTPESMTAKNGALPGGSITMNALLVSTPPLSVHETYTRFITPRVSNVTLSTITLYDTTAMPYENMSYYAENAVGNVRVCNDSLTFDGSEYLNSDVAYVNGSRPSTPAVVYGNIIDSKREKICISMRKQVSRNWNLV